MKVMSLNIWAGKEFDALVKYISKMSREIDIFCFQEVFDTSSDKKLVEEVYRANIFTELSKALKEHKGYFAPVQENFGLFSEVDFPLSWGIAIFIKKSLDVEEVKDIFIRGAYNSKTKTTPMPRNLQYAKIKQNGKTYTISHFHGLWTGEGKGDNDKRIEQSNKVKAILDKIKKRKILCGDFNLDPNTESLRILTKGNINLIEKFNIDNTRSPLYRNYGKSKFADYIIVSPDINVKSFEVPKVEISDHLPIILEFN